MYVPTQRLSHFSSTHIGYGMQRQTVVELIVTGQILPNAVYHQMQKLMLFMQEQSHSQVSNLFLRILVGRDEIDGFEVAKVDVPAEDVDVQQLADIFLLVVAVEVSILELLADVGQFLVDPLLFQFPGSCIPEICYELDQPSHGRRVPRGSPAEEAGCRCRRQLGGYARADRLDQMRGD